jgi:O-antigen ligase
VAFGQRIGGPLAWYATASGEPVSEFGPRALGLSASPVITANTLVSVVVPVLGFLAATWTDRPRARFPLVLASGIILGGVYVLTTRSAIVAIAASVLAIMGAVDARRRLAIFALVLAVVVVVGASIAVGFVDQRYLQGEEEDESAASHVAIGQVAVAVALDNALLGIGRENFQRVSRAYVSEVSLGGGQTGQAGQDAVGSLRPHNDFLEAWSSWGILGLLAYVGLFLGAVRNCMAARRSEDPLIRGIAVGCCAGVAAYAVNSAFHNYLDSSIALWCYAGLSAALVRMPHRGAVRLGALRRRPARAPARRHLGAASATA